MHTGPSTPHPIATYQHYLKDLYSPEYPDYSKPEFTRHRPKQIVNLVLVHREDDEGDKLQRECLLYQLHGNIDLIKKKKTPLTKDQITVLPNGTTARRVLIEGAPGIGKTTLLWQLCHQWADGELLQQWELVILVQRGTRQHELPGASLISSTILTTTLAGRLPYCGATRWRECTSAV